MFNTIIGFMNRFQAGSVILFFAGLFFVIKTTYKAAKNVLDLHSKKVTNDIKKDEERQKMKKDIEAANNEIAELSQTFESSLTEMGEKLGVHINESLAQRTELLKAIQTLSEAVGRNNPKTEALEERIVKIEKQIELLFESDKEYIVAYITEAYTRYVKKERVIDLLTLQNLESIYMRFLAETGKEDEFLSKLMKELRNLPTTKEKRE